MIDWAEMDSAPRDGKEFIVRYTLQGNVKGFCRWDTIHKHWNDKGEAFFPELQKCQWVSIEALLVENKRLQIEISELHSELDNTQQRARVLKAIIEGFKKARKALGEGK